MAALPEGARPINASELQKCAESADGRRSRRLRLVYAVKDGSPVEMGDYHMLAPGEERAYTDYALYDVLTAESGMSNPQHADDEKTIVKITPHGGDERTLPAGSHDALFWSESAVQKFFLPYYIRHLDKKQFDFLFNLYMGLGLDGKLDPEAAPVYALGHLPTSDYDDLQRKGFSQELAAGVGLLATVSVFSASGAVQSLVSHVVETRGKDAFKALL